MFKKAIVTGLASLTLAPMAFSQIESVDVERPSKPRSEFEQVVDATQLMSRTDKAKSLASRFGLDILDITWEDTGRSKGSSVGPNISDMSIQVHIKDDEGKVQRAVTMPVVRYPNFTDKSADLSPAKFRVLVGNESNRDLKSVTLAEYLDNFRSYLNKPSSWKGENESLLAPRDTHVLVSAQVSFLPIPVGKNAKTTFNPVLFNYQSYKENPAVLAIVATREGTSATIIDNTRDGFSEGSRGVWGQRLFHNLNGERASLTGQRQAEFAATGGNVGSATNVANGESGLNMVLLIQVPLVQKERPHRGGFGGGPMVMYSMAASKGLESTRNANVENAVIGHGDLEGPFTEIDNLEIKRDERFPIRVTVQFYKATDNANLTEGDMKSIRSQIDKVFKNADYVGSLVTEGRTDRPTEHTGPQWHRPIWWGGCWNTLGISEEKGVEAMKAAYGDEWTRMTKSQAKFESAVKYVLEEKKKQ